MGKVVKFQKRRRHKLPREWRPYRARRKPSSSWAYIATGLILGAIIGAGIIFAPMPSLPLFGGFNGSESNAATIRRSFTLCHTGGGTNCIVDGDTLWIDGVKVRLADIDAPETHPPRCPVEADLGGKATSRLYQLANEGGFTVEQSGSRDEDRYGRQLRVLMRDGRSLGGILVDEGLARVWDGKRHPWC